MGNRIHRYQNDTIEVQYEAKRCIHAAECVKRLNEVFDSNKRPWVQPQHASAHAVAETIHHCPTGALHYVRLDGEAGEPTPSVNTIALVADGPLYLRGDLTFVNAEGEVLLRDTRSALCRCGASQNKPFCDNSHKEAGFADSAIVDTTREAVGSLVAAGGVLTINPQPNGPLHILGNLEIRTNEGEVFRRGEAYLCRCGHSGNKPFCDDTHDKIGFTTG